MTLVYPTNPVLAAQQNLSKLLSYGNSGNDSLENITTTAAMTAFSAYKSKDLGVLHALEKYVATVSAYTVVIGIPVALVGGGAYLLFKDYIANASNAYYGSKEYISNPSQLFNDVLSNRTRIIETTYNATKAILTLGYGSENDDYVNTGRFVGGLAVLGATDLALFRTTGYQPIRSVIDWSVMMMSTALINGAFMARKLTTDSYKKVEVQAKEVRDQAHRLIFNQNKAVYDNIAEGLKQKAHELRHCPQDILDLRRDVVKLQSKLDKISYGLSQLPLQMFEVEEILTNLANTLHDIQEGQLSLRKSVSDLDDQFNADLVSLLTIPEFRGNELTESAQQYLDKIRENSLGWSHSIKAIVNSQAAGVMAGVSAAVKTFAGFVALGGALTYAMMPNVISADIQNISKASTLLSAFNGLSEQSTTLVELAGVAAAALFALRYYVSYGKTSGKYALERYTADDIVYRSKKALIDEQKGVYDGIASYLSRLEHSEDLIDLAEGIQEKLPLIKSRLKATNVIKDPEELTEELEAVLNEILKPS